MVIELVPLTGEVETTRILEALKENGITGYLTGADAIVVPEMPAPLAHKIQALPGVKGVIEIDSPFPLASRAYHPEDTLVNVMGHLIGTAKPTIMAGPCSVETYDNIVEIAREVRRAGGHVLRGGAYKPRTSPYSFQGHGVDGLKMLAAAREDTGLPVISEVTSSDAVPLVAEYVDILQVGSRSMQNYPLLQAVGQSGKPVLLKRGFSATIQEWLLAAEYILAQGNPNVILCERGIRTFETATRNTMDINAIPVLQHLTHLPVLVDPSHGVGYSAYVPALARAGIAAGAAGVIVEIHSNPADAWSDSAQTLNFQEFEDMVADVDAISDALAKRRLSTQAKTPVA